MSASPDAGSGAAPVPGGRDEERAEAGARSRAALPEAFRERLARIVPADRLDEVLASFARPRPLALRANTLRTSPDALRAELEPVGFALEAVPGIPGAFLETARGLRALQESGAWARGALYVQGLSSQLAPLALAPRPGEEVLDLCAAPGSKTTQLWALMEGRGRLVANDRSRARVHKLRAVCAWQGAGEVELSTRPGERFGLLAPESFDRVLVDAPCSGEGRFRLDEPETLADWKPSKVRRLAAEQAALLRSGFEALRPGGVLVYSTCTFAPEENEQVLARFLRRTEGRSELEDLWSTGLPPDGAVPPLGAWRERALPPALTRCARVLPRGPFEGFFLARVRRLGPG